VALVLVGYRGTGKSSVAPLVARSLGWPWLDMDCVLAERAGRSIRELFATEGEAGFRRREAALLEELATQEPLVLAAGGGIVLWEENRRRLEPLPVVWLRASPSTIHQRLRRDPRTSLDRPPLTPLSERAEIELLLREREPLYRAVAKLCIDTDELAIEAIAERIVRWIRSRTAAQPARE